MKAIKPIIKSGLVAFASLFIVVALLAAARARADMNRFDTADDQLPPLTSLGWLKEDGKYGYWVAVDHAAAPPNIFALTNTTRAGAVAEAWKQFQQWHKCNLSQ